MLHTLDSAAAIMGAGLTAGATALQVPRFRLDRRPFRGRPQWRLLHDILSRLRRGCRFCHSPYNLPVAGMTIDPSPLRILPCLDSAAMAEARKNELAVSREVAAALGRSAAEIAKAGFYLNRAGDRIDIRKSVCDARADKVSLPKTRRFPWPILRRLPTRRFR